MRITINLIPEEKKQQLQARRASRLVLRTGMMLSLSLIVFATFIFFCMQVLDIYEIAINQDIEKFKNNNPAYNEISKTQLLIEDYYEKSKVAKSQLSNQKQYWPVYQKINSMTPLGMYFNEILIEGDKVLLRGVCDQREAVIAFKDKLESNDNFEKIESPISNYVQDTNVEFEFKFELKK